MDSERRSDALRLFGLHRRPSVTADDLREAYDRAAKLQHPDRGGEPFLWQRIQQAYDDLRSNEAAKASAQGESEDGEEDCEEGEGEDDGDEDDAVWHAPLEPFDLNAALGLPPPDADADEARPEVAAARARAAFHAIAGRVCPGRLYEYASAEEHAAAVTAFRRACLAFRVLRDAERRRVYYAVGFGGLRASEAYQEESVFEVEAWEVRRSFLEGDEQGDREYLLLHGPEGPPPDPTAAARYEARYGAHRQWDGGGEGDDEGGEEGASEEEQEEEEEGGEEVLQAVAVEGNSMAKRRRLLDLPPPPPPPLAAPLMMADGPADGLDGPREGVDGAWVGPEGPAGSYWGDLADRLNAAAAAAAAAASAEDSESAAAPVRRGGRRRQAQEGPPAWWHRITRSW